MLQKLNERLQGFIAWIIVILVTITFTIFGIDYYLQNRHGSFSPQVKVNNQVITKHDFEVNLRRASQMQDGRGLAGNIDEHDLKKQVLDDMVLNLLSVQSATKNGFSVSTEQANIAILGIPQFQENGQFSNTRYTQALHNALYTHESFQEEVKNGMLINQQRFALVGTEFSLPDELHNFVSLFMQRRDYKYLVIPAASFYKQVKVSDEEVATYYDRHDNEYYYPERLSIDYVQVSSQELRNKINIPADKILQHYQDNQASYMQPAKWRVAKMFIKSDAKDAAKLAAKVAEFAEFLQKNPEKFAKKLAIATFGDRTITESVTEISADSSDFDESLLNLTAMQPISGFVKVNDGYVIYKFIAYTEAKPKPYDEVKDAIHEQLLVDAVQTGYAETLEKLADLSYQMPDSLEMVAKVLDLEIKHSEVFDKTGGSTSLTKNPVVLKSAFSQDVLELGNNSEPLQIDSDRVIVLRVGKHIPASKMPLKVVKDEIRQLIIEERAKNLVQDFGKKLVSAVSRDFDFNNSPAVGGGQQFVWKDVQSAHRDTDKVDPVINDIAFTLNLPGDVTGKAIPGGNYVIVSLTNIQAGKINDIDKEQIASINQQIESGYGLMDYNLYINGLLNKAKIVHK